MGARGGDLLKLVVRGGLRLALAGVAVGLPVAFALSRYLSSLLFDLTTADPRTYLEAALLLTGVAALARLPARPPGYPGRTPGDPAPGVGDVPGRQLAPR